MELCAVYQVHTHANRTVTLFGRLLQCSWTKTVMLVVFPFKVCVDNTRRKTLDLLFHSRVKWLVGFRHA